MKSSSYCSSMASLRTHTPVIGEVMVDEEHTLYTLPKSNLHISLGLLKVQNVDDRENGRSRTLEQLAENLTLHLNLCGNLWPHTYKRTRNARRAAVHVRVHVRARILLDRSIAYRARAR